jgi:hypothetical protein
MAQRAWVRMFCAKDRQARVATFHRAGAEWQLLSVDGSAPSPSLAAGGLPVAGSFGIAPEYRGCPACGSDGYVRCTSCGQLSCWDSNHQRFACGNCESGGPVSGRIESLGALDIG